MSIIHSKKIHAAQLLMSLCVCTTTALMATNNNFDAAVANALLAAKIPVQPSQPVLQVPTGHVAQPNTVPVVFLVPQQQPQQSVQPAATRGFFAEFFIHNPVLTITTIGATIGATTLYIRSKMRHARQERINHHRDQGRLRRERQLQTAVNDRATQSSVNQGFAAVNNRISDINDAIAAGRDEAARQYQGFASTLDLHTAHLQKTEQTLGDLTAGQKNLLSMATKAQESHAEAIKVANLAMARVGQLSSQVDNLQTDVTQLKTDVKAILAGQTQLTGMVQQGLNSMTYTTPRISVVNADEASKKKSNCLTANPSWIVEDVG